MPRFQLDIGVRMPKQVACRSAHVRRHRRAVECRLHHRLTLLPWPRPVDPPHPALA